MKHFERIFSRLLLITLPAGLLGSSLHTADGAAHFTKITTGPVVNPSLGIKSSSIGSWADFDNDGYLDLIVATDDPSAGNFLYKNNRLGGFTELTVGDGGDVVSATGQTFTGS